MSSRLTRINRSLEKIKQDLDRQSREVIIELARETRTGRSNEEQLIIAQGLRKAAARQDLSRQEWELVGSIWVGLSERIRIRIGKAARINAAFGDPSLYSFLELIGAPVNLQLSLPNKTRKGGSRLSKKES